MKKHDILKTYLFVLPYILVEFTNVILLMIDKSLTNSIGKTAIIVFSSFVTLNWAINTLQGNISTSHQVMLARDKKNANKINTNAIILQLITSIIIAILLFIFAHPITYIYMMDDSARDILTQILKLKAFELPIISIGLIAKNNLKVQEKTNLIWISTIISSAVNIIGDLISIKCGYNEIGIYISTILANIINTSLLFMFAKMKKGKYDLEYIKELIMYTKDFFFDKVIQRIVNILYTRVASSFGTDIFAIHSVCIAVNDTLDSLSTGYYSGLLINYANDIEKGKKGLLKKADTVEKYSLVLSSILIAILVYPCFLILGGGTISWEECLPFIWFYQIEFVATMSTDNYIAYLSANKDTKAIRRLALIGGLCVRIPLVYLTKFLSLGLLGLSFVCGIDRFVRTIYARLYIKKNDLLFK